MNEQSQMVTVPSSGTRVWYLHGELHREDGPAVEFTDGSKVWCLHGRQYDEIESWAAAMLQHRMQSCTVETIDAFVHTILKKQVDECI